MIDNLLRDDELYFKGYRGSRKVVMERMLLFHANVLNKYNAENIINDPVHYQRLIIRDAETVPYAGHYSYSTI